MGNPALDAILAKRDAAQSATPKGKLDAMLAARDAPKPDEPFYEDFAEGVAVSGMEVWYGMKDLAGTLTDEDKATFKDWKDDAAQSGWGTAGRVAGEVAQFAVPGGAVLKGAKGLSKAKASLAALGTDVGVGGARGATKLPDEGETRLGNAAWEAGGALAGGAVGGLLSKSVRGAQKVPGAQDLIDKGVYLTPGRAAKSKAIVAAETLAEFTPFAARGTLELIEEGAEGFARAAIQEAAPRGAKITEGGQKGAYQLIKAWMKKGRLIGDLPEEANVVLAAMAKAGSKGDRTFTPKQLFQASSRSAGDASTAMGGNPLAKTIQAGQQTVGREIKGFIPTAARRLSAGVPTPVPRSWMKGVGRALMGDTKLQKNLQGQQELADMLRSIGIRGGALGGAYED